MQAGASGSRAFRSRAALPSEWDRRHYGRQQHVQDYLKVDGLTVKYVGPGESDSQAATLFADKPVPNDVPLYYFEVTIVNKGDSGYIGIGFCTDSVNLGRLPGWEPHSYGYHGDDGHAFHGSGHGRPFGPGFTTGDVVGALLDRSRKNISYYKNGEFVGIAFYDVQEQQLYPCVGMRTKHEEVRANFGGAPFCVDLNKLHAEFKERVLADIAAVELPVTVEVTMHSHSSRTAGTSAGAAAGPSSSSAEVEAAAAACTQAIRALDSSSSGSAALADLESATQAYLAALEAAALAGDADVGAAAAAAAGSSGLASAEAAAGLVGPAAAVGKANQPLLLYYVFNYLLHRRCWKTAAIIAREMVAVSSSSSGRGPAAAAGDVGSVAGEAAATAMDCSTSAAAEDHPMPDAAGTAAAAEQPPTSPAAAPSTCSTAAAAAAGAFSEADVQDALRRQKIYSALCAGHVADALTVVKAQYGPAVLEQHPRLHFKLRVQQFVELVRQACDTASQQQQLGSSQTSNGAVAGGCLGGSSSSSNGFEAALAYGRAELGPGSKSEADEELLSDALSLLAYADPAASPCGHLLRETYRAELAEELNGALLQARGGSGQPLLECAYRQAVVLVDELKRNSLPAALVLDVPGICCGSSSSSSRG